MEQESDFRRWDELILDALGLIFGKLSLQDVLTVVPQVCKSWNRAVAGPYCWQEVDIEEWSEHQKPEYVNRMVQMLVTRSCGSLRTLCVSSVKNDFRTFSIIAENAGSLHTLRLPRSEINDWTVEQLAGDLSAVTCLDLSYCSNIGAPGIQAIGKSCRFLTALSRNMHPLDMQDKASEDEEARAIATTMPRLKRLELAYQHISTESVMEILSGCPDLELLDLRGCWDVILDQKMLKEKSSKLKVLGPLVTDYYDSDDWDDCSYYSDETDYMTWELFDDIQELYEAEVYAEMWGNDAGMDQLEVRFFEGFGGDAGLHGWPPSP